MPRETIRINRYGGGKCDDPSPKNLRVGELKDLVNLDISADGKLSILGKFTSNTALTSGITNTAKELNPGYGLFTFSADYTSTGGRSRTDYMVIAGKSTDNNKKVVEIFESDGTALLVVNLTTDDTTNFQPSLYYIDGALRISDGNLNSTAPVNKWVGYVENTHFEGTTVLANYSCWLSSNQQLGAPTAGLVGDSVNGLASSGSNATVMNYAGGMPAVGFDTFGTELTQHVAVKTGLYATPITAVTDSDTFVTSALSAGTWASAPYQIFPPAGAGVNVDITPAGSGTYADGQLTSGTYRHAISFVYDDSSQESRLYRMSGKTVLSTDVGTAPYSMAAVFNAQSPFDPRIKKIRFYSGLESEANVVDGSGTSSVSEWLHTLDIRLDKGLVLDEGDGKYAPWSLSSAEANSTVVSSDVYVKTSAIIYAVGPETYESKSGNNDSDTSLHIRYKTVTINNRIAYYGGALVDDKLAEDSIYKSVPNKFDATGKSRRLDVATQDGESVVALESYADRLLEFKERTLYVINTAQDIEFVEGQFDNMGIDKPFQVTRTEYGIVWFNDRGCYIYDGQRIRDLFLDPNDFSRRLIELNSWRSFKGVSAQIGYDEREKKVFIWANSSGNASSISVKVFDFNVYGWSDLEGGIDNFTVQQRYTNMTINPDGRSQVYTGGSDQEMLIWSPETTKHSSRLFMETKEFDLGNPGIKKNLYVVYVNHKNAGTGLSVKYRLNGTTTLNSLVTSASATVLPNTTSYVNTRLTPSNTSVGRNFSSISLVLEANGDNSVPEDLEIGDIEIIARRKVTR